MRELEELMTPTQSKDEGLVDESSEDDLNYSQGYQK